MQAHSQWKAPGGTLGKLVAEAGGRVSVLLSQRSSVEKAASEAPAPPSFEGALRARRARRTVALIAELKRASPSRGVLDSSIDAALRARDFERGGATAISVLTEPDHFGGSPDDLMRAREAVALPLLKKDFHVHPLQAAEARALGASAMLLIARALGPVGIVEMAMAARDVAIEILVEIRDETELEWALDIGATVIGVNNRNLESLRIDSEAGERIIPLIPSDCVAIAESGIRNAAEARAAAAFGADAILVGSALTTSGDPVEGVRALAATEWVGRAR